MKELFVNPDGYFRSMEETNLRTPFFAVCLLTVLGLATSGMYAHRMTVQLSDNVGNILMLTALISGGITAIILPFFGWVFFSGSLHTVASRYTETNEFRRTVSFVGYGFIPLIFFRVIYSLGVVTAVLSTSPPDSTDAIQQFDAAVSAHPYFTTVELLTPVFFLWTAFLWVFAVKRAHELDIRQAVKVVAFVVVPVAVGYLYWFVS